MIQYEPTIGMEIHVELKTNSKMFCSCVNNPDEEKPNKNICPVCMAHPGTLPVANKKAIEYVIKAGLALNCRVAEFSKFDRKNYFYPDLPKGYQISQYDQPLCEKGHLEINGRKIKITRIHLEEDTGKLVHPKGAGYSLVDFNRAGVPLMELVTEPDIKNSTEAKKFCRQFQLTMRYLGISDADMEKGHMRCEANISVKPEGRAEFGTKVEIKNLNSFKAVERSIEYEIKRQTEVLDEGGKIIQETRGWDSGRQKTYSQRIKEEAHDYRYFPDPDLSPLDLTKRAGVFDVEKIKNSLPELPLQKKNRFINEYQVAENNAETLVGNLDLANYFEQIISELGDWMKNEKINESEKNKLVKLTVNYLLTEFQKLCSENNILIKDCKITPENFAELMIIIRQGKISSSAAQAVLKEMFSTGGDPSHLIKEKGLEQVSDEGEIEKVIEQAIKNSPRSVKDYKSGKEAALKFLIGQVMRESKGKANPGMAGEMLKEKLGN
jgi:aspartyl-tRNA(Asn)/glutamyl-tRNA(Gln) amidotransferase subunit B